MQGSLAKQRTFAIIRTLESACCCIPASSVIRHIRSSHTHGLIKKLRNTQCHNPRPGSFITSPASVSDIRQALQVAAATSMYCTMVILPYSYEATRLTNHCTRSLELCRLTWP